MLGLVVKCVEQAIEKPRVLQAHKDRLLKGPANGNVAVRQIQIEDTQPGKLFTSLFCELLYSHFWHLCVRSSFLLGY